MCYVFLWRWFKLYCINNVDYDDCFSACSNIICEYLNFLKYDVGFVDVVN